MMELEQNGTNITETAQGNKHLILTTKTQGENIQIFFVHGERTID